MIYENEKLIRNEKYEFEEKGDDLLSIRIEENVDWMIREMKIKEGCFE